MNRNVVAVRGWNWQRRQANSVTRDVLGDDHLRVVCDRCVETAD